MRMIMIATAVTLLTNVACNKSTSGGGDDAYLEEQDNEDVAPVYETDVAELIGQYQGACSDVPGTALYIKRQVHIEESRLHEQITYFSDMNCESEPTHILATHAATRFPPRNREALIDVDLIYETGDLHITEAGIEKFSFLRQAARQCGRQAKLKCHINVAPVFYSTIRKDGSQIQLSISAEAYDGTSANRRANRIFTEPLAPVVQ